MLSSSIYIILFSFILVNIVFPILFTQVNIDNSYLITYYVWFNILIVLYFMLPKRIGTMFE
jgi:hypothetical protein